MKKLILTAVLVICLAGIAQATVTFDFDAVASPYGASNIETYMEGLYGSDMIVTRAVCYSGTPLTSLSSQYTGDRYIAVAGSDMPPFPHSFSISFNDVQITSVSFDWGKIGTFYAEADGTAIFSSTVGGSGVGSSGTIDLVASVGHPVTTLTFHNSSTGGSGGLGIDNLVVTAVPEPATICLLGLGALSLIRRKK